MTLRTARQGPNAGSRFWGCPNFPKCRGIVPYEPAEAAGPEAASPPQPVRPPRLAPGVRPPREGHQSSLFQALALPKAVAESVIELAEQAGPREYIRALSQFRLDYRSSGQPPADGATSCALAVVEKLLLRGDVTYCTWQLDRLAPDGPADLPAALEAAAQSLGHGYRNTYWDSREEQVFYERILPGLAQADLRDWCTPQVSLGSLAGNGDGTDHQRVDFGLLHPAGLRMVIEIDGLQHQDAINDRRRDGLLQNEGYAVVRIPAHEVRAGGGPRLEELRSLLTALPPAEPTGAGPLAAYALTTRIQIALLRCLQLGWLSLTAGGQPIGLRLPAWAAADGLCRRAIPAAVADLTALVRDIATLYGLPTTFGLRIVPQGKGNCQAVLALTDALDDADGPTMRISSTYLPFDLAARDDEMLGASRDRAVSLQPDQEAVRRLFRYVFRFGEFREGQWPAIERALRGQDTLVLLPTGGGKSAVFQLAGLLRPGLTLVVAPLVALIDDQQENLAAKGIQRVAAISSSLDRAAKAQEQALLASGHHQFCYISPERLLIEDFRETLASVASVLGVGLIAIDEAHCVSEWGHDFRPAYLLTGRLARRLCAPSRNPSLAPPLIALTGTASRAVLRDVQRELDIQEFEAVITPKTFDRPELKFRVIACSSSGKDAALSSLLSQFAGRLGQVDSGSRPADGSESVTGLVFFPHVNGQFGAARGLETIRKATGAAVGLYTGAAPRGYPEKSWDRHKRETARQFRRNELVVLACTTAFGMGIDKPNIRFTVHTNLPRSIEGFYQEAGRAARGKVNNQQLEALCVLLVSDDWREQTRQLLNPDLPSDEVYRRLDAIERNQQGDVERQFFFHRQAYGGREGDLRNALELLGKLGDLDKPRVVEVAYGPSQHDRERTEKAAYRLMAAGVLSDYTHRYEHRVLALSITEEDMDGMIAQLEGYLSSWHLQFAGQIAERLRTKGYANKRELARALIEQVIAHVYDRIEGARRRSLMEMHAAATQDPSPEAFRARILAFLDLGEFEEELRWVVQSSGSLQQVLERFVKLTASRLDSETLRGQSGRYLESYPGHPGLLFLRAYAEAFCAIYDVQTVVDNLRAAMRQVPDYWEQSYSDMTPALGWFCKLIAQYRPAVAERCVEAFMEQARPDRAGLRALARALGDNCSASAAEALNRLTVSRVHSLLSHQEASR